MNEFERFIIYPMLFIALFFSFADDGVQQITAQQVYDEIIAKRITLVNSENQSTMILNGEVGAMGVYNNGNKTIYLGNGIERNGMLSVFNKEGEPLGLLTSSETGNEGTFVLFNEYGDELIYLGLNQNNHGLICVYDKYGEDYRSYSCK